MDEKLVLDWELSDDKKTVKMEAKGILFEFDFDLVEEIIEVLGACRYQMDPPVTAERPTEELRGLPDPIWSVGSDALHDKVLLSIRDLRFGWLNYLFTPENADALAAEIGRYAHGTKPPPPRDKMN